MDHGEGRLSKGVFSDSDALDCPLVRAWSPRDKWQKGHIREAILLSLEIVRSFERACASAAEDDLWLILSFS